jgi:hypothetical protein
MNEAQIVPADLERNSGERAFMCDGLISVDRSIEVNPKIDEEGNQMRTKRWEL